MEAAVYLGAGELIVKDIAKPDVGPGEVLIKVEANTICGTDLRIAAGAKNKGVVTPVILGHELAGSVVEIGDGVNQFAIGDKVGVTPSVSCNSCYHCQEGQFNLCTSARVLGHDLDGGMAEYFLAPAAAVSNGNLVSAPSHLSAEEIALAEPLSCALHGQSLMGTQINPTVVIIGGGAIGQLHAQLAKVHGAATVIVSEPVESRRALARQLGADLTVDPLNEDLDEIVCAATQGRGADAVIVCIGVPQLVNVALDIAAPRGKICLFAGFPKDVLAGVDANLVHYKELQVTGSSNSTTSEYRHALALIADGRINVKALVTHRYGLESVHEALRMASAPQALKVVLTPAGH